jgi:hypothetical protein
LSFNNEKKLGDQDLLTKACFKEENPRVKEKLLLKVLLGPAYDDGNEIKESIAVLMVKQEYLCQSFQLISLLERILP